MESITWRHVGQGRHQGRRGTKVAWLLPQRDGVSPKVRSYAVLVHGKWDNRFKLADAKARAEELVATAVREDAAKVDARIGELCREGKTVYYAFLTGGYCEHTDRAVLGAILARGGK